MSRRSPRGAGSAARFVRGAALLLAALAAGACGAPDEPADTGARPGDAAEAVEAPPAAVPQAGAPWTAEDSARAVQEDSTYEARLMQARQQSMDSYEGCLAKTRGADPEQRKVLEAACARARGQGAAASPP